jgi:protocatechuate 3,4-dioxygenase beta subunit
MKNRLFSLTGLILLALCVTSLAADSASKAEKMRFAGTVVDWNGKPQAGVVVELYQFGRGFPVPGAEMKTDQTTTTAENGSFEFRAPASATVVFARKPGLAPAWASYWNPQTDVTDEQLVLTMPASIKGTVVDDADKPVSDALVFITTAYAESPAEGGGTKSAYLTTMPARDQFSAKTGADGKFRIDGCPTNATVDLGVKKAGKVLRDLKRQYVSPETMRCRPGKAEVKLVLDDAGIIEGKVRSQESGQPLAGARISLQRQEQGFSGGTVEPVESKTDGTFRLSEVGPGSYRVQAVFGTNALPELVAESVSVNVEAGKTTRDVEISASKGGFLEVAVLGKEDRKPVSQVGVNVFKDGYAAGQSTDSNGLVLLRLPPGNYRVNAYRDNSRSEQASATVEAGATNHSELEIAQPLKITGVVRDPAGEPVEGLQLRVVPGWRANIAGPIKTDAEGRFEFAWNPQQFGGQNNVCCIVARDEKRNLAAALEIEEGVKLDLRLEPGLTIAGRVEDTNGKPLTNVTVNLYIWSGNSGDSFTDKPIKGDAQGRFEVTALPPGRRYSVHATAKGYGSGDSQTQEIDADSKRLDLPAFTLNVADRKLAGQVVDSEEKPVASAWVHMYGRGQPNSSTRTDDQGHFRFEEVCEGRIQISASAQSLYGNVSAEAGDTNVLLKLGVNQSYSSQEAPRRPSLKGKPLPDLAVVGLPSDCAPAGKQILLCLFDVEQRPSRRFTRVLAEQHDSLRQKGLTVLGLQAAVTTAEALKEWKDASSPPFPVGQLAEKSDKTKWASEVESMPWLILTDAEHNVVAEGFALDEIDAKLKEMGK